LGGKAILWASFIEVSEVDADAPLAILLHKDGIGEPVGVEGLSDEAACSRWSTSLSIARLCYSFILLGFCFTGLVFALMESLWQIILGSIPGILVGAHANTSKLSDKNFLIKVFS